MTVQEIGHAEQSEYPKAFPDGKSYFLGGWAWGGSDVPSDGSFYTVSAGSSEVWHTGEYAEPIARWGTKGTGPGQFDFVRDPADADGLAFGGVAVSPLGGPFGNATSPTRENDRVQEFDAQRRLHPSVGGNGSGDGQPVDPIDVAVGPDGCSSMSSMTPATTSSSSAAKAHCWARCGGHGSGDGQLDHAGSIFVDAAGTLYAADTGNSRVQAWGPDGTFLWSFGSKGTGPGQFDRPTDVGADAKGNIYVVDRHRLQIFGPDKALITTWSPTDMSDAASLRTLVVAHDDYVIVNSPYRRAGRHDGTSPAGDVAEAMS